MSVSVTPAERKALKQAALDNDVSVSALIRLWLEQYQVEPIFGNSEFVAESLGLLADRVKSHTARPRRIKGGEGFSSHGHLLAAKIERKAA